MNNNDYHNRIVESYLSESYRVWFEEEAKYLAAHVARSAVVLDVGSGDGRTINDLLPVTKNITGIDHDTAAIERAKERFKDFPSVHVETADATKIPFEDGRFDFVTCMGVLMNLGKHRTEALREMKRVVKDGGKIILDSFSERSLMERLKAYEAAGVPVKRIEGGAVFFDESIGDNISEQFTEGELRNIFDREGLIIEDMYDGGIVYIFTVSKKNTSLIQ